MTFPDMSGERPERTTRHTVLRYSLLRLGMFVGVAAVMLLFVHGRDSVFVALIVAGVVSGIASYFLLARQREPLAQALDRRLEANRQAGARRSAREDEADDAQRELHEG